MQSEPPHPVDVHVGASIRIRRKFLKISQSEVASAVGLTFQQVQKYERGANRVSASKLYEIARFLKMPLERLFEGFDQGAESERPDPAEWAVHPLLATREGIDLAQAFPKIRSAQTRRKILDLVEALAEPAAPQDGGVADGVPKRGEQSEDIAALRRQA